MREAHGTSRLSRVGWTAILVGVLTLGSGCGNDPTSPSNDQPNNDPQPVGTEPDQGARPDRGVGQDSATPDRSDNVVASPAVCDGVAGTREVVVIPVHIGNEAPDCAPNALSSTWFSASSSVAAFYSFASAGRLSVDGRVAEAVTIPSVDGCIGTDGPQNQQLLQSLYPQIDEASKTENISGDAVRVYVLPASIRCGAKGPKGAAQPPQARIFLYGDICENARVSAHELGHVLGMNHASGLDASGKVSDVGDESDVMGRGFFSPNAPHRAQVGWLEPHQVVTVAASGSFQLAALGCEDSAAPQLLLLNRNDKAVYISYRQPRGLDAELPAAFADRTSIHEFVAECPPRVPPLPKPLLLGTVGDGETFDAESITIRQLSHDAAGAVVEIQLPGQGQ